MTIRYLLVAVSGACCAAVGFSARAAAQPTEFTVGHVFISVSGGEGCGPHGTEAIIEIDPTTGAVSVFADCSDGLNAVSGLRFTPDGTRLLALSGEPISPTEAGSVQAFNPDGTSEVILDRSDGLLAPFGSNALAFDFRGDLYVLNTLESRIRRYRGSTGPGIVFANFNDGILGRGSLDFAPNGDLFYCGDGPDAVIRITPQGQGTVFDQVINALSLVFDRDGNLFVSRGSIVLRYDNGDAGSQRVLASEFVGLASRPLPLALSPDGGTLYVAEALGATLYRVDANDGTKTVVANWSALNMGLPFGMTVFDPAPRPPPPFVPTVSAWGLVLTCLLLVVAGTILIRSRTVTP